MRGMEPSFNTALLATIIVTVIAVVVLSIAGKWRTLSRMLRAAAKILVLAGSVLTGWLRSPLAVPRYYLVGWLLACAIVVYADDVRPWHPGLLVILISAIFALCLGGPARRKTLHPPPGPPFTAFESATLAVEDHDILKFVGSGLGEPVSLNLIRDHFGWEKELMERFVNRLAEGGWLNYIYGYGTDRVALSDKGLNFVVDQGWLSQRVPPTPF